MMKIFCGSVHKEIMKWLMCSIFYQKDEPLTIFDFLALVDTSISEW